MNAHTRLNHAARDRVALYVLGGMSEAASSRFEEHLEVCECCRGEVSDLRPTVNDLLLVAPEADPPPELKARLMERVRRTRPSFHPALGRDWLNSGTPGIDICQLWVDRRNERQTILIRMKAGASIPNHLHADTEECFVVEGDLRHENLRMGPGDYVRFEEGTSHTVSSEKGCLLLVRSSLRDERLESPSAAG